MPPDDAPMDDAYALYLRTRNKDAKSDALCALLRIAEPFIGRVVRHFSRGPIRDIEPEEALQQARIGFIDAVRRADPAKGPLRPFAMSRIRHELQSLAEVSFGIKVPRRSGLPGKVLRAIEIIYTREGREPTEAELNGSAQAYAEAPLRPRIVASISQQWEPGDHGTAINGRIEAALVHDAPSALDLLIEREDSARTSPKVQRLIDSALARPVISPPRL